MNNRLKQPLTPVAPDGMEIIFFYPCPRCGKHIPIPSPTEPRMLICETCRINFPIIPVEEQSIHFIRIMLAGGKAAADPDFL